MNPLFRKLAELHRKAPLRKRDFTIDYEKFLRLAGVADGDGREIAEKELRLAEMDSSGALKIDRAPKSGIPERIRIALVGGESWLSAKCGSATPAAEREVLANFFEEAASRKIRKRWAPAWRAWCGDLALRARAGGSVKPFLKVENEELMHGLIAVINWQGDSFIRFASAKIFGDSKKMEKLKPRLTTALEEVTGESSLEAFGIFQTPRSVMLHGAICLEIGDETISFSALPDPFTLVETNLIEAKKISTEAHICMTVENKDVFMELAKQNPGVLLIHTSFPGSAVRRLITRLPEMRFLHFGDSDPSGFDILRDLREKTERNFQPLLMNYRPSSKKIPLSPKDAETLARLIANPLMGDVLEELLKISGSGDKGIYEQELVSVERVTSILETMIE